MPFALSKGQNIRWIRIDAEDLVLAESGWYLNEGYAFRLENGRTVYLHRQILGLTRGDGMEVDHINRNRLDNRRSNLRLVTRAQQMQNVTPRSGGTSRFRGVSFDRRDNRWIAQMKTDGRCIRKPFRTEEEAHRAVVAMRAEHMPYSTEALEVV